MTPPTSRCDCGRLLIEAEDGACDLCAPSPTAPELPAPEPTAPERRVKAFNDRPTTVLEEIIEEIQQEAERQEDGNIGDGAYTADLLRRTLPFLQPPEPTPQPDLDDLRRQEALDRVQSMAAGMWRGINRSADEGAEVAERAEDATCLEIVLALARERDDCPGAISDPERFRGPEDTERDWKVEDARAWLAESERIGEALTEVGKDREDTEAMRHVRALLDALEAEVRTSWRRCPGCGIDWPHPSVTSHHVCPRCTTARLRSELEAEREETKASDDVLRWKLDEWKRTEAEWDRVVQALRSHLTLATGCLEEIADLGCQFSTPCLEEMEMLGEVPPDGLCERCTARQTLARITEKEAAE